MSSEWQAALQSHFSASREQLARALLAQQAAHREQRANRRVVDASAEQARRAALAKRVGTARNWASAMSGIGKNLEQALPNPIACKVMDFLAAN